MLDDCRIGARCNVHSGAVIGSDGFGFAPFDGRWIKIPQLGAVSIGDDVEIGANTTIDRGAMGDTVIEDGVKLDNQIQIAHNCVIGADTVIAACVGIAGSTKIGKGCRIGGAAMIAGHITIADGSSIGPATAVPSSLTEAGHYTGFFPLMKHRDWERAAAVVRNLPRFAQPIATTGVRTQSCRCERRQSEMMDIQQILKTLPHRYPFVMVDRVLEIVPGERIVALKNVTINEPYFVGHFPRLPVMPGVMIIEALAQAAALLTYQTLNLNEGRRDVVLLCGHRRRALQAAGDAGRSAAA